MLYQCPLVKSSWSFVVTGDREDVNSIALTVVKSLMEKYDIKATDIGRLEVRTNFYRLQ